MKRYIAEKFKEATPSAFTKTSGIIYADTINFGVGDPDLRTDEIIIEAAYKDSLAGHTHYTDTKGYLELREEIAAHYRDDYNIDVHADEVQLTISGCQAMSVVMLGILDPGDEVIVPSPCFTTYIEQIELASGVPVFLKTTEENDFKPTPEQIENVITDRTKAIIINTPNNPTGACLSREELKAILDLARKREILVICDDIYTLFTYEEDFYPMLGFDPKKENVIAINSFSKDYVMTGWRMGWIVANKELLKVFNIVSETIIYCAPAICQRGTLAALKNRSVIQPKIKSEYEHRMMVAYERLKKLKNVKIRKPQGTFYLFPDISQTGLSSQEVVELIYDQAHVVTIDGEVFGPGGEGHIRLAVTVDEKKIHEAFDRIEKMEIFR